MERNLNGKRFAGVEEMKRKMAEAQRSEKTSTKNVENNCSKD